MNIEYSWGDFMRWRTHRAIGMSTYSLMLIPIFGIKIFLPSMLGLMTTYFSSYLPDQIEKPFGLEHRGPTHSLVAIGLVFILAISLYLIFPQAWLLSLGLYWGYAIHIIADGFTDRGVSFLWPIKKRYLIRRLWWYNSGDEIEGKLTTVLLVVTIGIWVFLYFRLVSGFMQ